MKKIFKISSLLLVGMTALSSCFAKKISKDQALQILEEIINYKNNSLYSLGPIIVVYEKTKELQGVDILEKEQEFHVVQSDGLGRSFVYYSTEHYLGEEKIFNYEYWAFVRQGQFNEKITKGELVENTETEDPDDTIYKVTHECNYETDVVIALGKFWEKYGYYYSLAAGVISKYDKPTELKDYILDIDLLIEQKYKVSQKYTTTGNRSLGCEFKVGRSTTGSDLFIYEKSYEYMNSKLTKYEYNHPSNNIYQKLTFETSSTLLVPGGCEVVIPDGDNYD